ncbi:MAG: GxxExxY protein [Chitinophagales bacterium]
MTKTELKDLTYHVTGAAIEVHKALGPGLLESVYHKCMEFELKSRGISFESELIVPIIFKGNHLNSQLRCDLFIEKCLVLELKAVDKMVPVFEAQLLTYMRLLKAPKGILINFSVKNLYNEGQKTYVNDIFRSLEE